MGPIKGVKNSLYLHQKRPKNFLVVNWYLKASPENFQPPRPTAWPSFTALSKSVSARLSTTKAGLCTQAALKNGLAIYVFHNEFLSSTLLCPLGPFYKGQSVFPNWNTFINTNFGISHFLFLQIIIWLNSWIFCQRCFGQKLKPYELEGVQNAACSNFSLKLKNGKSGRSVYISAVCCGKWSKVACINFDSFS